MLVFRTEIVQYSIFTVEFYTIVCIGFSTLPPSFLPSPLPLNQQTVQAPVFRKSRPTIWFFVKHTPPP